MNREDTGNANPDNNVRFDLTIGTSGGYIYNLSTKGLTQGVYSLSFYVGADHTFLYDLSFEMSKMTQALLEVNRQAVLVGCVLSMRL